MKKADVSFLRKQEFRSLVPPKSRSSGFAGSGLWKVRAKVENWIPAFAGMTIKVFPLPASGKLLHSANVFRL